MRTLISEKLFRVTWCHQRRLSRRGRTRLSSNIRKPSFKRSATFNWFVYFQEGIKLKRNFQFFFHAKRKSISFFLYKFPAKVQMKVNPKCFFIVKWNFVITRRRNVSNHVPLGDVEVKPARVKQLIWSSHCKSEKLVPHRDRDFQEFWVSYEIVDKWALLFLFQIKLKIFILCFLYFFFASYALKRSNANSIIDVKENVTKNRLSLIFKLFYSWKNRFPDNLNQMILEKNK